MKCDQYWPARGTETYGLVQVTLLDTVELATYTVRTFALHKVCPPPGPCRDSSRSLARHGEGGRVGGRGLEAGERHAGPRRGWDGWTQHRELLQAAP